MKKLLLAITLLLSINIYAQNKDIKMTMLKPGAGDKIINGQPFQIEYIITNNGTVATATTDSMIVLYFLNNQQVIVGGQSPAFYTNRVLAAGDTIWRKLTLNLTINGLSGPATLPFCTRVYAQTGNVTIDPDQTNNVSCANIVAPVSEVEKAIENLQIYPNPATHVLNISFDYAQAKQINIIDLNGRIVEQVQIEGTNTAINTGNLSNGIYLYQINSVDGSLIKSGKFTIDK
ncbi:MAG: T9SS type A sorting domain-containing protein [Bacteroidota bacterium]|nr:T9SS type A sorting domain-containing protein [Bacteroidota bacterium]